jgi:DNA-binding MarR family transcriptional regulator
MKNEPSGREIQIMMRLKNKECCIEELGKEFSLSFHHIYRNVAFLKKRCFIQEVINPIDRRIKILSLTHEGKLYLGKLEVRKSAIAKLDSWLDKKFSEIGIDCQRLFSYGK